MSSQEVVNFEIFDSDLNSEAMANSEKYYKNVCKSNLKLYLEDEKKSQILMIVCIVTISVLVEHFKNLNCKPESDRLWLCRNIMTEKFRKLRCFRILFLEIERKSVAMTGN